jgi:hypothetical protein
MCAERCGRRGRVTVVMGQQRGRTRVFGSQDLLVVPML